MPNMLNSPLYGIKVRCQDVDRVQRKLQKFFNDGFDKLMVVSDFDYTISRFNDADGKKCCTTHGVFELENPFFNSYLRQKCVQLKEHYLPIEFNPNIAEADKIPLMEEWWRGTHKAILDSKISYKDLANIVVNSTLQLRDGADEFLFQLNDNGVPLVIFSAGIGNIIEIYLKAMLGGFPENLHLISNMMNFDENGIAESFSEPLIHTFCKNASVIHQEHGFFKAASNRSNIILLGDSLGDLNMDVGVLNEGCVLKIGFLNFNYDSLYQKYMDGYDIVLLNDQTMNIPLSILNLIGARNEKLDLSRLFLNSPNPVCRTEEHILTSEEEDKEHLALTAKTAV